MGVPIPIPYGLDYTSTASGTAIKDVICEHCSSAYVYQIERTGTGTGSSFLFLDNEGASQRASGEAQAELEYKLLWGVDVVPCPACGHYQRHMVAKAWRLHRKWMKTAGICVFLALLPLAFIGAILNDSGASEPAVPWGVFVLGVVVGIALGVGLLVWRSRLAARYDPNALPPESRIAIGRERAILRSQLETLMAEQQKQRQAQSPLAPQQSINVGQDPTGQWRAEIPEMPGVVATAATREEAIERVLWMARTRDE